MQIKEPKFFGIHAKPQGWFKKSLAIIPFLLLIMAYITASHIRHQENPQDKIMPTVTQMKEAVVRYAFVEDMRSGKYLLLEDTKASLTRLLSGIGIAGFVGLLLGLNMGIFGGLKALGSSFMTFISIVPPLAVLPILFIVFGVDEFAKITLIFIGTFPLIARSIFQFVTKIPREQITKALTLGASQLQVVYQVLLPQIMPRLIDNIRLSFGAGWLFLIAAEAVVASQGLGYRIFLVRRYMAMDVIIPYTFWITFLGFTIDYILRKII